MKKITLSVILISILTGSCSLFTVTEKYSMENIKVGEEEKYTLKKITYNQDYINESIRGKQMTYFYLLDRVFDISKEGEKFIFQGTTDRRINESPPSYGSYIYERKICDKKIYNQVSKRNVYDAVYSNDGERIAYIYRELTSYYISISNIKPFSGNPIKIKKYNSYLINPNFFTEDSSIMYSYLEDTNSEFIGSDDNKKSNKCFFIYKYNFSTQKETKICSGYNATFVAGDKNQIVFCRKNYKWAELWYRNLKTGEERLIIKDDSTGLVQPSVSPDGKKIAFTARAIDPVNGNNFDIYVVDIDGKNKRQITFHPGNDYCPEWSNDGNSIYFVSQRGNKEGYHCIWNVSLIKYFEL
jgi:Tol biopolymer transport system component